MRTLNQIKADRTRKIADEIISYKNSPQSSYFNYRLRYNLGKVLNQPLEKVVVPLKPTSLCEVSVIFRSRTKPEVGLKLWDCGSRKQSSAILAEL